MAPRIARLALVLLLAAAPAAAGPADPWKDLPPEAARLAAARDFKGAAAAVESSLAGRVPAKSARAWTAAKADLDLAARGLALLAGAVAARPGDFKGVTLDKGPAATVTGASAAGLQVRVGAATLDRPWASLAPPAFVALLERAALAGGDAVAGAGLLRGVGLEDEAERALVPVIGGGGPPAAAASEVVARWRRDELPPGGYVVHEGAILLPGDRDRALLEARMAAALDRLRSGDAAARRSGRDELVGLGEPARMTLLKALLARRAALAEHLRTHPAVEAPATRARLRQEIEKRRAAALALIEDPKRYPYPSASREGQAEVNRLVAEVEQAWRDPVGLLAAWDPGVAALLADLAEVEAWLAEADPENPPDPAGGRAVANAQADVPGLFKEERAAAAKVLEYNRRVRTTADAEERDNTLAVNEYREMMGRGAVKIDERLLRAARGHSIHMRKNAYFAHEAPVPELATPNKRAARQGYGGGVSENIAFGTASGRAAFDGWFHSAGHHRNMLGARWTEMGCGRSHTHYTQLFGAMTGKALAEPDPLPPPAPDVAPDTPEDFVPQGGEPPRAPGEGEGRR